MGAGQSTDTHEHGSSPEEMSQLLAHRFATKCFTPLELTHLKDNFHSLALEQGGLQYWNEEILSQFLGIPDGAGEKAASINGNWALDAGPVIFRMVSYLGAFPFQKSMAPSVLTFDALLKVVVLLTDRYGRILRKGKRDRIKLLFGSLADVGRKEHVLTDEPKKSEQCDEQRQDKSENHQPAGGSSHVAGFMVDEPANDEGAEDDDDLALAALESLDAIEVFKYDQRVDRTVYEARISIDTFRRLLMLLVVIAPLRSLEETSTYFTKLDTESINEIQSRVDSILEAFFVEESDGGISYTTFFRVVSTSLPFLFDPLTPLFEHLLFSKNLDLSRKKESPKTAITTGDIEKPRPQSPPPSPRSSSITLPGSFSSHILDSTVLSQLSFFLSTSSSVPNLFQNGTRFHPVFSSATHGESLTSFSHNVLTWQAPSLLLLKGVAGQEDAETVIAGAYLPYAWKTPPSSIGRISSSDTAKLPCLFQLSPKHVVLQGSPSFNSLKESMPLTSVSNKSGIALGYTFPPSSRGSISSDQALPKPSGGGSLLIDSALESATFNLSGRLHGDGIFLPSGVSSDFPSSSTPLSSSMSSSILRTSTTNITIYNLEVWGIVHQPTSLSSPSGAVAQSISEPPDAISRQQENWNFEAREAERRRTIHMNVGGGDSEAQTGRALLEMAGILGDSKYSAR